MNNRPWVIAGILLLITAWFSTGNHQGDEHFQILEFAAYKLGLASTSDLAWEFHERMRPALQPAMAYVMYKIIGLGGAANPFTVALLLRILSAAYTLFVALLIYRRLAGRFDGKLLQWFILGLLFHWCAYYNGVRFSSENWSGLTLALGLLVYPLSAGNIGSSGNGNRRFLPGGGSSCLAAGILFGLAFLFRYQIGLAVVGFGLWLLVIYREKWQNIALVVAGGLLALLLAYPLSYWLYGEWTLPAWNYLASNLIEGKAATYGTKPWYGYLELVLLRGIPPLSLVYLAGTFVFCWHYRRDPVAWAVMTFVLVHSVLARKDIRFLFPLIPLLPIIIFGAAKYVEEHSGPAVWDRRWNRFAVKFVWVINLILLAVVMVMPANSGIAPSKFIYDNYPGTAVLSGTNARLMVAGGTVARFYNRPSHVIDTTGTGLVCTRVPAPKSCLYLMRTGDSGDIPPGGRLVYTSRPAWIEPLNFAGWLDRERWYRVYEF